MFSLYEYKGTVVKVYDADTITVLIDQGLNTFRLENLRLKDIDAPEVRGEEIMGKEVYLKTEKDKTGKYGRYIATIWLAEDAVITETNGKTGIDINYININDWLVENKYAEKII